MTRQKDQKRRIRTRMKKTGESYTAARAVLVARKQKKSDAVPRVAPRKDWPKLAGMSDEKVKAATGCTWGRWVDALDYYRAYELPHRDIARLIGAKWPEVSSWWRQTVTVGYERIRGLRDIGQRRDGAYEAGKSCTFPVPVATLYKMFSDPKRRKAWLPTGLQKIRTATPNRSMRIEWQDDTHVHFYFTSKGAGKSSVAIQHVKLPSKAAIDRSKSFWTERLAALKEALK